MHMHSNMPQSMDMVAAYDNHYAAESKYGMMTDSPSDKDDSWEEDQWRK